MGRMTEGTLVTLVYNVLSLEVVALNPIANAKKPGM